jgi:hypothetical protein
MKNRDLIMLVQVLAQFTNVKGKDFAYAVFKNKQLIEQEIKIFDQMKKQPHPDYMNYEQERQLVCINYADKDENGNPVVENNHYKISSMGDFQKEMDAVRDKYKEVISDIENSNKEFEEFLDKDADVKLVKVAVKDLPESISAEDIDKLAPILKEE